MPKPDAVNAMNEHERDVRDERRWSEWMRSAQRGDAAVYTRLLGELGRVIESYIRVRFGQIDALEDCVQDCLIAIHQARHTYDPARAFRPWMFTIVRHKAIDTLRRRQTWLNVQGALAVNAGSVAEHDALPDRIDGIRILEKLSPAHRQVVILAKYGGYTTAETAETLGISESAAKGRLHRALNAVMQCLEREDTKICPDDATS